MERNMGEQHNRIKQWDSATYIQDRLDKQQQYLSKTAGKRYKVYIALRTSEIIAAALIPVVAIIGGVTVVV